MPRLGVVLGAVLAEIARARSTADFLTRDLVEVYTNDPILAGMTVPRTVLDEVTLNLKFQISDVQETPVLPVAAEALQRRWSRLLGTIVFPESIRHLGLSSREALQLVTAIVKREPLPEATSPAAEGDEWIKVLKYWNPLFELEALGAAVEGNAQRLLDSTSQLVIDSWRYLPEELRRRFGSADELARRLTIGAPAQLAIALQAEESEQELLAALRSRLYVLVQGSEIGDPAKLQSLTLTFSGADIDTIVKDETEDRG
jgi:hypothetical protein